MLRLRCSKAFTVTSVGRKEGGYIFASLPNVIPAAFYIVEAAAASRRAPSGGRKVGGLHTWTWMSSNYFSQRMEEKCAMRRG